MGKAHLVAALVLLVVPVPVCAEEAADIFNQLYGDELKRVAATPATADDVALARQMLADAEKAEKQPELLRLLCEKAFDLAAKDAAGYPTAMAAADLLAERVPEKKVEMRQKCVALWQKQYAAARADAKAKMGESLIKAMTQLAEAQADAGEAQAAAIALRQALVVATTIKSAESKAAVQTQLDALVPREKAERQIAALKAKLEANPTDAAARKELVHLYLVEKDSPAEAAKLLDESLDETTRKYVPAAAKPVEEAPELACRELGDWYRGLAEQAQAPATKAAMLRRAQVYYVRFLDLHAAEDLVRTGISLSLRKVEDALAKLPGPKSVAGGWVDALKLVDPARHAVLGRWTLSAAGLSIGADYRCCRIALPIAPQENYEVQATFIRRTDGNEATGVMLPVGRTLCMLEMRMEECNLKNVDAKLKGEGVASVKLHLAYNQPYTLDVKVGLNKDQAEIVATLDDKPLIQWRGPAAALSLDNKAWSMPDPRCLGLSTFWARTEFSRVRVRALSGELKVLDKPKKEAGASWTDCLKLVDPAKDAIGTPWQLKNGTLSAVAAKKTTCQIALPVVCQGSYRLQASLVRTDGKDSVIFTLPVGGAQCFVDLSRGGDCAGIGSIKGKGADGFDASVRSSVIVNDRERLVDILVLVRKDDAEVWVGVDEKLLMHWAGPVAGLYQGDDWRVLDMRCPGLGVRDSSVEYRKVQIRALADSAKPPADAPWAKPSGPAE